MWTSGTWHNYSGPGKTPAFKFHRYTTTACKDCARRKQYTRGKANGRTIDRCEYAGAIKRNNKRVTGNPGYYRQRQQIADHPSGTLKRQRGFTFTLLKGKEKVLGEIGLEFIGYNLTRCLPVMGVEKLIKSMKKLPSSIFKPLFEAGLQPF